METTKVPPDSEQFRRPTFGRLLKVVIPLLALMCFVAGATAFSTFGPVSSMDSSGSISSLPVQVIQAEPASSYEIDRVFTGTLKAAQTSPLGFERGGLLNRVLVEEGDLVAEGAPLAHLDSERLEAEQREIAANIAEAEAVLAELRSGPRQEKIQAAEARVRELEQQLALAQARDGRRQELLESETISAEERDQTQFNAKALEASLEAERQTLKELQRGTRQEQIRAQEARLEALLARRDQLQIELDRSVLLAPFSGTVSARHCDEGMMLNAGQPVVTLVEDERMEAWVGLPQDVAGTLPTGAKVEVEIDGDSFPARVQAQLPEIDPATRLRSVVIRLEGSLPPSASVGKIVRIRTQEEVEQSGFWLPLTALSKSSRGLWACYVIEPAARDIGGSSEFVAKRADVEIIHAAGEKVFVQGSLPPRSLVIASGIHRVVPGQRVHPLSSP